jgi:hypothetical protein
VKIFLLSYSAKILYNLYRINKVCPLVFCLLLVVKFSYVIFSVTVNRYFALKYLEPHLEVWRVQFPRLWRGSDTQTYGSLEQGHYPERLRGIGNKKFETGE